MTLKIKSNNITSFLFGIFIIVYAIIVKSEIKLSFSLDYYTILLFIGTALILLSLLKIKDSTDTIAYLVIMTPLIYLLLFLSGNPIPYKGANVVASSIIMLFIYAGVSSMINEVMINNYYSIYKEDISKLNDII